MTDIGSAATTTARVRRYLSFANISALYIFVAMFLIFALWVPDTFLSAGVWRSMLDTQALNALAAIALVIPLAAGSVNLAVGAEIGFASIVVARFIGKQHMGIGSAVAITLVVGAGIGAVSGLMIARARIDSFIATLGVSSVLGALTAWVSNSQQILNLGTGFEKLASTKWLGVTTTTWFMIAVAVVAWYLLECTPAGRRVYATGGNLNAARLAGVRTSTVIVLSLAGAGLITAATGVLQSARIGAGDPTVGPGFLLPAFAAAFLGSTQFRGGRYNVWGAVVAVYVLATGVKGLQLAGAPVWIPDLFNGLALLLAVGMAVQRNSSLARLIRRRRSMSGPSATKGAAGVTEPDAADAGLAEASR
jgi:ribose transport system permease protein